MSDYLDPTNKELLKDFFEEAEMQVETLEQNILTIENDPNNKDAVDEIFRAAHTLKGGAATVEMSELAEFTHLVEDLLDEIRGGNVKICEELIDSLLQSMDIIKKMLRERMAGNIFSDNINDTINALNSFLASEQQHKIEVVQEEPEPEARPAATPGSSSKKLTEYDILELRASAGEEGSLMKVTVYFNEDTVMNTVGGIQVYAALKEISKIIKTKPEFELLYEDNFFPEVVYYVVSKESEIEITRACEIPEIAIKVDVAIIQEEGKLPQKPQAPPKEVKKEQPKVQDKVQVKEEKAPPKTSPEQRQEASIEQHKEEPEKKRKQLPQEASKAGSVLRVDSRRIDELMNLVSQAVINKATFNQISLVIGDVLLEFQEALNQNNALFKDFLKNIPETIESFNNNDQDTKQYVRDLSEKYGAFVNSYGPFENNFKGIVGKFKGTIQNLGRITNELQEGVMRIRMVPVAQIFSRFPRLVRDLSRSLKKNIQLHMEGEETELDKSVIEDLLDPLIHCVRNALDHGIESPEEREAANKPVEGSVWLKACNKGNVILIEIEDDGKGIDVDRVREKAINRGILHPEKKLSDIEAFNLIFEPGFSTAQEVTNISGRGVGLDVVKKKIEKLNGSVSVWSEVGKGTKLSIKLPLTLAIIQGLLVKVGSETYAIPITSVIDSHRIKPSDIKMIDNYEVFNLRDNVLSIIRLNRIFQIPEDGTRQYHYVVVVGSGDNKVGLIVDALIGEEDVVIKPLKDRFSNSPGIAGATILGDGSVSLIIDVGQLLDLGLKMERNKKEAREARIM